MCVREGFIHLSHLSFIWFGDGAIEPKNFLEIQTKKMYFKCCKVNFTSTFFFFKGG